VRAATCVVETALVWQLVIWVGVMSDISSPHQSTESYVCHAPE
jgi:hypothetical protein